MSTFTPVDFIILFLTGNRIILRQLQDHVVGTLHKTQVGDKCISFAH